MPTSLILFIALLLSASSLSAQTELWQQVSTTPQSSTTSSAKLSQSQKRSALHLLRSRATSERWCPSKRSDDEFYNALTFESIALSARKSIYLVQAGPALSRTCGPQPANGAMWIVQLDNDTPTLLAAPEQFSGWLYSIQPTVSYTYHDAILGWHMGYAKTGLTYFRFDGRSYQPIATASLVYDLDANTAKIVPTDSSGKSLQPNVQNH